MERFSDFLEANSVDTKTVTGGRLPGYGLSLVAGEKGCKVGDPLLTVPTVLHLTPAKVRASPLGEAVADVIPSDDDSGNLALGLLGELAKGDRGPLWPYLEVLPTADDMVGQPLLWGDDELQERFGRSHLYSTIAQVKTGLLQQWEALESRVVPKHPDLFPPEIFNLAGYLYAHAIVLTRALPFGDELSLIPFLDLANHRARAPNTCSIGVLKAPAEEAAEGAEKKPERKLEVVETEAQLEALGVGEEVAAVLTAGEELQPGEQVFIDYGEAGWRSSWEMLYTYGFVPGSSPEEWMASGGRPLFFDGVEPSDPLTLQKRAMLVALGASEDAADGTWCDVQPRPDQCVTMAPLLRLAALTDDGTEPLGVDLANWKADPKALWARLQTPLSDETEARVGEMVIKTCEGALAELPTAEELLPVAADKADELAVEAERERLAARVLLGERAALEVCIGVWQKALEKVQA